MLLYGQYEPMLSDGSQWYHYFWFEAGCNHHLVVEGDTILNERTYKKILNKGDNCNFSKYTFAREDTTARKVWYYYDYSSTEALLYDFSLDIGDTVVLEAAVYSDALILDSISNIFPKQHLCDLVSEIDRGHHKIFYLSYANCEHCINQVLWIEGVGNISNPFLPCLPWTEGSSGDVTLCHFDENGTWNYHYPDPFCEELENPCLGTILNVPEVEEQHIEIYPNPFEYGCFILPKNTDTQLASISFYNLQGVLQKRIDSPIGEQFISLSELPNGVIYVILETQRGQLLTKRLLKQ